MRYRAVGAVLLGLGFVITSCGASASAPASTGPTVPVVTPTGTSPTAPVTTPPAAGRITVDERDDHHSVRLSVGQQVQVVLASTYWQIQPSSDPAVLTLVGSPQVSPKPSGCVAGAGCGTASATFLAKAPGRVTVVATRTSCGEALGCSAAAGRYAVTVVVR